MFFPLSPRRALGLARGLALPGALVLIAVPAKAQERMAPCVQPDSVVVRGNKRMSLATIRADAGVTRGDTLNYRVLQRALRNLYATGQFDDLRFSCDVDQATGHSTLVLLVTERPLLGQISVDGTQVISEGTIRGKLDLPAGKPLDPALVARAVTRIDSAYRSKGYFLASVKVDTTLHEEVADLNFDINEGNRLSVSGVQIIGADKVSPGDVTKAMKTKPEGFFWFQKGEFDEENFAGDLGDRIPKLYASHGYIDFLVLHDSLLVDKDNGKGLVQISVNEGRKYRVGSLEIVGNRHFSTEELDRYFPFAQNVAFTDKVMGMFGKPAPTVNTFDETAWDDATNRVRSAYANEGYIYAQVKPVIERTIGADSLPMVNLRWEIDEKTPATVNRIEIVGNTYTSEACIREQLVILPGDVFNQDRLIRSYQNIQNLNFFESPLPPPDTKPSNDKGDVDVIFKMKEKRTGSVNFGASAGEGTGIGGFIGLDQPNLFGTCKRATMQWQFGRYNNSLNLSYTDPSIRQSRISATVTAYHIQAQYVVADLGQNVSTGGSIQFGFPVFNSPFTRFFVSYRLEQAQFTGGIASRDSTINQGKNTRSTFGLQITHDNRIDLPFASAGSLRSFTAQFNGGILGGSATFQRYTGELRNYTTIASFGGDRPGAQPVKLIFGLSGKVGGIVGDVGAFFYSEAFALGGTRYGEQLRGYEEFSITPNGFVPGTNIQAQRSSFGNAFITTTLELGLRFNQMFYTDIFFDAGNVWADIQEFDPSRLYRGAGMGIAVVTPLGPLGLDYAYGFDRVDVFGRPAPKWQLHFKLGNLF